MATTSLRASLTHHLRSPSLLTCAPASSLTFPHFTPHRRHLSIAAAAPFSGDFGLEIGENAEAIISGEWPENFSYLSYDDLLVYLKTQILTDDKVKPKNLLGEVMSAPVRAVTQNQRLVDIMHHFEMVSGLPVVDGELRCIGVISKKDLAKASKGVVVALAAAAVLVVMLLRSFDRQLLEKLFKKNDPNTFSSQII